MSLTSSHNLLTPSFVNSSLYISEISRGNALRKEKGYRTVFYRFFGSIVSDSSSTVPNDILNMIENLPLKIKDQIKTLTLEARSKRIIRILHNYLKNHQVFGTGVSRKT